MLKSEVEAEEFEKQAKQEIKNKNYELSKSLFEKARDIYLKLNYMGKVSIIEKQIAQIKRVIDYEGRTKAPKIQKTKSLSQEKEKEQPIIIPEIVKTNKMQEVDNQINKGINDKKQILSEAELRRAKLREQIAQKEKEAQIKKIQNANIKQREEIKRQELQRKDKEFKTKVEKENEKNRMINDAENAMDRAKSALENKQFNDAKTFYKEALDIFKKMGWFDQADILYREIQHVEIYKTEYLKKQSSEDQKRQKREELFQKRVDALLEEQSQKKSLIRANLMKLPPEIRKTIDKINLLIEKAEKEVNAQIYDRALNRYEYILELYNSVPSDILDLTNEKFDIRNKINDLKSKI